jgi:hypothetical protein
METGHLRDGYVCLLILRLRWWWVTDGTSQI